MEALSHYRIAAPRCRGLALPLRKFLQTKIYTDTSEPSLERATASIPSSLSRNLGEQTTEEMADHPRRSFPFVFLVSMRI